LLVAALLGMAAADATAFAAVALAAVAMMVRWGSGSLSALAGGQAVLGPAGLAGSGAAIGAAWYAAVATVLASPGGWLAFPFGAAAAVIVAGPAAVSAGSAAERAGAAVVGVGLALLVPARVKQSLALRVAVAFGALAVALAAGR